MWLFVIVLDAGSIKGSYYELKMIILGTTYGCENILGFSTSQS